MSNHPTYQELRQAFLAAKIEHGIDIVFAALKHVADTTTLTDVPEDKRAELIEILKDGLGTMHNKHGASSGAATSLPNVTAIYAKWNSSKRRAES
jgi:hypothetical protein